MITQRKIVIIGSGQLGSRHLQALALLGEPTQIFVVDPAAKSRRLARECFEQVKSHSRHSLLLLSNLSDLEASNLDLVIVATNSNIRYQVVKSLLSNYSIKYLILEKFLFQQIDHFKAVGQMLNRSGTLAFVNCPRRMFPDYKQIREQLVYGDSLHLEVVGNNWGLGCNGIHFIDLFHFLNEESIIDWQNYLVGGYKESKRKGYVDFTGRVVGKSEKGNSLILTSYTKGKTNISVRINTPSYRWVIYESLGQIWCEQVDEVDIKLYKSEFKPIFQSSLTNIIANQLFKQGTCELTPYKISSDLHRPYLSVLLDHYNQSQIEKTDICPIT